jgi:Uma2 family endonuclease
MPVVLAPKAGDRPGPFTFEEYLEWEAAQDEMWELVDGYAVRRSDRWWLDPVNGTAGATFAHNLLVANVMTALNNRLRGGPCMALPSDLRTRSRRGNARYPDITVECGRPANGSLLSEEPRVLIEVLSPSNTLRKQLELLDDYQTVEAVEQVVYIEQAEPSVLSWSRARGDWPWSELNGLDAVLELPSLGVRLPLAEVYEGLQLG